MTRKMNSEYMEWAKTHASTKYSLTNSGMLDYPLSELPISLADLTLTGKGSYGYEPLLNEIAKRYRVKTENVFISLGTSMANHMAMATILEAGDEVLVEHPTYELLHSTAQHFGVKMKRFSRRFEDGFQIDIDELKKKVSSRTKLIVITNLHNPSGVLIDDTTLKQVGNIAQKIGAHVLVDEVYLEALFENKPRTSFHLGDEFIVTSSLTKVFGLAGLRCGWVIASKEIIRKMWRLVDLFNVNMPSLTDQLSVIAFQSMDKITRRTQTLLKANHAVMKTLFDTNDDLEVVHPEYGTIYFPRLKKGSIEKLYSQLVNKYDTSITPGRFFEMPQHFRIGIGCETKILKAGVEQLGKALREIRNAKS